MAIKSKSKIAAAIVAGSAFASAAYANPTDRVFPSDNVLRKYGEDVYRATEWVNPDTKVIIVARDDFPFNGITSLEVREYIERQAGISVSQIEKKDISAIRNLINSGRMGAKRYEVGAGEDPAYLCFITAGRDMGDHVYDLVSIFSSLPDYFLHGHYGTIQEWRWAFMIHEMSHCNSDGKSNKFDFIGSFVSENLADLNTIQTIADELSSNDGLFETGDFGDFYRLARAVAAVHKTGIAYTTSISLAHKFDAAGLVTNQDRHFYATHTARMTIARHVIPYLPKEKEMTEEAFDYAWRLYARPPKDDDIITASQSVYDDYKSVRADALNLSFTEFEDQYVMDNEDLVRLFFMKYEDIAKKQTERPDILGAYYQAMVDLQTDDMYVQALRDDYVSGINVFFPSLANMYGHDRLESPQPPN